MPSFDQRYVSIRTVSRQLAALGVLIGIGSAFPYIALIAILAETTLVVGNVIYDYVSNYSAVDSNLKSWYTEFIKKAKQATKKEIAVAKDLVTPKELEYKGYPIKNESNRNLFEDNTEKSSSNTHEENFEASYLNGSTLKIHNSPDISSTYKGKSNDKELCKKIGNNMNDGNNKVTDNSSIFTSSNKNKDFKGFINRFINKLFSKK